MNITSLKVFYNNSLVGYLKELDNGMIAFQYSNYWLNNGFSISPISLPLKDKVFISKSSYLNGLYGVFFDSLPDGWANLVLQRHLANKGINYERLSPLTKLSLLGDDSLGGLSYKPSNSIIIDYQYDFDKLCIECNNIIDNKGIDNLDEVFYLGGSSGGSRPKVHVKIDNDFWIVKFPCSYDENNIGIKEYEANSLARECGIKVNDFHLFESKMYKGYFGAKRFDRDKNKRIHMISLSGILETTINIPNLDYKHLFQVTKLICNDEEEMYEAYKRMCFNVLYSNKDDHGKNFAFLYDENKKTYVLSPFYDITKTTNKYEHEMTCLGKGNPNEEDLLLMADEMKLSRTRCEEIISKINKTIKHSK